MSRVLIATGGTGGHLLPAQAVGEALQAMGSEVLLTGHGLLENRCFYRKLPFQVIRAAPLRARYFFRDCAVLGSGLVQALWCVRSFAPDLVVGFGSFHTAPVLAAAKLCRRPIALVESNAVPGRVNRFFSRWADLVALSIPDASACVRGAPCFVRLPERAKERVGAAIARRYFGLDPEALTLLVFGGSLGAMEINRNIVDAVCASGLEFQVIHLTGNEEMIPFVQGCYAKRGVRACVKSFEDQMSLAWESADCALCRAGGGTVAEIVEFAVPSLLLPYPYASDDHQRKNAEYIERLGGGVSLSGLGDVAAELAVLPGRLAGMRQALIRAKEDARFQPLITALGSLLF